MKSRPILFNGDMVRAILAGKWQTRRPIVPQPIPETRYWTYILESTYRKRCETFVPRLENSVDTECGPPIKSPFGLPGDQLYVRETFCPVNDLDGGEDWIDYRATPSDSAEHPAGWHHEPDHPEALKWKPSIHMPRSASRITLEVTGVRVERLQSITTAGIISEGLKIPDVDYGVNDNPNRLDCERDAYARDLFAKLWDSIYGKKPGRAWKDSPWVWCCEFKLVTPED